MNIAFLPVRGGSKGIHLKNIRNICGVPLLQHTLYTLDRSPEIDVVVVATDCYDIERCAVAFGSRKTIIYDRLPINATDESPTEAVMIEFFQERYRPQDNIFLIQVTNPFLREEHIHKAFEALECNRSVVTVTKDHRFLWDYGGNALNYNPQVRPRRQDWDGILIENGAMYVTKVNDLLISGCRISPPIYPLVMEGKYTQIEIDEFSDILTVEAVLRRNDGERLAKLVKRSRPIHQD